VAAACLAIVPEARAQTVLTLADTISRARDQAGAVAVARARIAEAEAGLLDASARFRENPIIETNIGPRSADSGSSTELDIGVSQLFETGGQRAARIAGAQASIERQRSEVDVTARGVVFEAASAFLDGLAASERLRIAEEGDTVSRELLHATERRYSVGDIAAIDLNLARIDAARTGAIVRAARADLGQAVGRLRTLLRLPSSEPVELFGSLDLVAPAPLEQLRNAVDQRPEFIALLAETREAEAQVQLGRALGRPDVGFRVGYEREQTDTIILGGLTVILPAFQRGRGTTAAGAARALRARLQLDTARQAAITELEAAYTVYEQRRLSSETFMSDGVPSAEDNENLARRSYEAGELNLMDFLLIRRDALDTRTAVIDRRLDAARSRLTVDFVAGVLR
jgi:cobalt-zinc-cadmium efflux system outer membrane protein